MNLIAAIKNSSIERPARLLPWLNWVTVALAGFVLGWESSVVGVVLQLTLGYAICYPITLVAASAFGLACTAFAVLTGKDGHSDRNSFY